MLSFRIPLMARCTPISIQHYVIKLVSDMRQVGDFFPGTSVPSTNKTDYRDIPEILLKVALNTITLHSDALTKTYVSSEYEIDKTKYNKLVLGWAYRRENRLPQDIKKNALHEIGNFCFAMGNLRPHLRSYLLFTGCLLEASEQWHS